MSTSTNEKPELEKSEENSINSPLFIALATFGITLSLPCRNCFDNLLTTIFFDLIKSKNGCPAPTGGSWSTSPIKISCDPKGSILTKSLNKFISIMEDSSTIKVSNSISLADESIIAFSM